MCCKKDKTSDQSKSCKAKFCKALKQVFGGIKDYFVHVLRNGGPYKEEVR